MALKRSRMPRESVTASEEIFLGMTGGPLQTIIPPLRVVQLSQKYKYRAVAQIHNTKQLSSSYKTSGEYAIAR